jgi:hypothetical protein
VENNTKQQQDFLLYSPWRVNRSLGELPCYKINSEFSAKFPHQTLNFK